MSVIFARTRHTYDSYSDFWDLVRLSGFEQCFVDEIELGSENVYITSPINGEIRPHMQHRRMILNGPQRAKVVWWNLERPDATHAPPIAQVLDEIFPYINAAWVSDRLVASLDPRFQHVVLGGHVGIRLTPPAEVRYDFAHMSYAWGRRANLYQQMTDRGLRMAPIAYGPERDRILSATRIIVNAQQYQLPVVAPLRFILAAAYSLPILTEAVHDGYPLAEELIQTSYDDLPDGLVRTLVRGDLQEIGLRVHRKLCEEFTFRRGVEEGLAASGLA